MKRMWNPARVLIAALSCVATGPALAVSFDFEDGTLQGWAPSQTGGTGSTSVEIHLGTKMALVQHTGSSLTSLAREFAFVPSATLAFDMHAVATPGGFGVAGYAGVTISFLNALGVSQGSLSLLNTSSPSSIGPPQFPVDGSLHHYSGSMASFASSAGLTSTANVAKVTLTFLAYGGTNSGGASAGSVWFDNVVVGELPPTCSLQLNKSTFRDGESIMATVARLANPDANSVPAEVKIWFEPAAGQAPIPFATVGADGLLVLPGGFSRDYGPFALYLISESTPRGAYLVKCRVLHAVTGVSFSETSVAFQVQ